MTTQFASILKIKICSSIPIFSCMHDSENIFFLILDSRNFPPQQYHCQEGLHSRCFHDFSTHIPLIHFSLTKNVLSYFRDKKKAGYGTKYKLSLRLPNSMFGRCVSVEFDGAELHIYTKLVIKHSTT